MSNDDTIEFLTEQLDKANQTIAELKSFNEEKVADTEESKKIALLKCKLDKANDDIDSLAGLTKKPKMSLWDRIRVFVGTPKTSVNMTYNKSRGGFKDIQGLIETENRPMKDWKFREHSIESYDGKLEFWISRGSFHDTSGCVFLGDDQILRKKWKAIYVREKEIRRQENIAKYDS
jgi:hypothetical protein